MLSTVFIRDYKMREKLEMLYAYISMSYVSPYHPKLRCFVFIYGVVVQDSHPSQSMDSI